MVARPFPALDQLRPRGNAEWTSVGTGSPTAVTVKVNRWPTRAVALAALIKAGVCRPDVGRVVGGAVLAVVGGTVLTVVVGAGVDTGPLGKGLPAGAPAIVRLSVWAVLPAALVAVRPSVEDPASAAVGVPERVAVPSPLSVSVSPSGSGLEVLM